MVAMDWQIWVVGYGVLILKPGAVLLFLLLMAAYLFGLAYLSAFLTYRIALGFGLG